MAQGYHLANACPFLPPGSGHSYRQRRISQIDVSAKDDAVVLLADDPARVHLGREQFGERLRAYLELAPTLRARVPAIDYVDLRFETRIFVRPIGATGRPAAVTNRTRFE